MNTLSRLIVSTALSVAGVSAATAGSALQQIENATDGLYEPAILNGGSVSNDVSEATLLHVENATDGLYEPAVAEPRRVSIASMEVKHVYSNAAADSSLEAVRENLQDIDD